MKIGLLNPSILMTKSYEDIIFAPREHYIWLADELVSRGHTVYAYTSSNTKTKAEVVSYFEFLEDTKYPSVKDIPRPPEVVPPLTQLRDRQEYALGVTMNAFKHAKENNVDVMHIYMEYIPYYFAKLSSIPSVITLRDPVFEKQYLDYQIVAHFKDLNYICISNASAKTYQTEMDISPVGVVYHGVRLEDFNFEPEGGNDIAFLGRFLEEKGVVESIETAKHVNKKIKLATSPNYRESDYYIQQVKPSIDSNLVTEYPYQNIPAKNTFLGSSKVTLFPTKREEPFGMVMIESMATGTPVVAYAQGSVPEVIKDGVHGFIVNRSDDDIRGDWIIKKTGVEGLKEAIERIYNMNSEDYKKMRQNCRSQVENNFTISHMAANHEKVYKEIASLT